MKVTLDFDTEQDGKRVPILAMRADAVQAFLCDLVSQLSIWSQEKPEDEQSKAFNQVCDWVIKESAERGLCFDEFRKCMLQNRAGEVVWKRTGITIQAIEEKTANETQEKTASD
jgi:hypothetical protein